MSLHYVIIAPHPDDEIIGCYCLLANHPDKVTIAYGGVDEGCYMTKDYFHLKHSMVQLVHTIDLTSLCRSDTCLVAPDPYFEFHPDHRFWGMAAETIYRSGKVGACFFYSTIMRAPYIFKLDALAEDKKQALDICYPKKSDLWKYDHRYFLFEGLMQIHRPHLNWSV